MQADGRRAFVRDVLVAGDRDFLIGVGTPFSRQLVHVHPAVGAGPLPAVGHIADIPVARGANRKRIARFDVRETHLAQVAFEEPAVVVAACSQTADPRQRENYRQFVKKFHND